MKKLRWQLIIIFLTGLVVGVLLLGEQPLTAPQFKPEPVQGGIYSEGLVGSLQRLNPLLDYYNPVDRDVDRLIFSGLLRYDERGIPQADLAETWGISQDGQIYNFTLRTGILWHDGEPLTSEDVVFTIDLIKTGGETIPEDLSSFWQAIEVKALNATNLQFQLPNPYAPFLDYLTFGILPRHILGGMEYADLLDSDFNLAPIGSGPFKFSQLLVDDDRITGVVLTAFEDYYRNPPYIDQIVLRYYPDSTSAYRAYQEGDLHAISRVDVNILESVLKDPGLSVYTGRLPQITFIFLNLQNPETPFFRDASVRKALLLSINRQWIIDRLLGGQAVITDSPILPGTWAYYDGLTPYGFDVDQAVDLMKDAGFVISADAESIREKDGVRFEFTFLYPEGELYQQIAEAIQEDWQELNIQVNLEPVPYDQLVNERLAQRDYHAALVDINLSRFPDPDPYPFWNQVQAVGGQNYSQWDDKMASEYLEQARVAINLAERERLYHNFQVIFHQELPSLPLFYPVYTYAVDANVLGVSIGPMFDTSDRFLTITDWYMEARLPSSFSEDNP